MNLDTLMVVAVTIATAAAGLWLAFSPRSYLRFAAKFPLSRVSTEDVDSRPRQLLTRVSGCFVLGLAAALAALVVHVSTS